MGAITAHVHGLGEIAWIFFVFGFIAMLITLPLIIYRYIKYNNIPDSNKPFICIFTALFSILIVGYLNSVNNTNQTVLTTLYLVACIFYLFSFIKLIEYRNLEFYPSYSAFTFPFVISAIASKEIVAIYSNLNIILYVQIVIATFIVLYVLIKYIYYLKSKI